MKVMVIGAGVGGLAVARGLLNDGHAVTVVERARALRQEGAAVTLWPNGTAVLADFGVSLDGLGRQIEGMASLTHQGRPLMQVNTSAVARRFGTRTVCAPRRHLVDRLLQSLPPGTVTFGRESACVEDRDGCAVVTFTDGATEEADVVVGADGRGSSVRRQLWAQPETRPTGWVTWQGLAPVSLVVTESSEIVSMLGPEGFVGLQPAGEGLLQWFFSVPPSSGFGPPVGHRAPLAMLRQRFAGYADPVPQLLEAIADADPVAWPHHTLPVPRVWGAGRITLLGDAAHAMPPSLAQGVNQTLEDAYSLTRALDPDRVADSPAAALRHYEATRARQVTPIARMAGTEATTTYHPLTQLLMRAMPQRLSTLRYQRLLERSSSILNEPRPNTPVNSPA